MPSTFAWMTRKSLKRQAGRELPDLLQRLIVGRLARLDDQVADAELLDERHHLLLRAGADRQHRDDRGHAEDHAEHRQERAQLVRAQVLEARCAARAGSRCRAGDAGAARVRSSRRAPLAGTRRRSGGVDARARAPSDRRARSRAFGESGDHDAALGALLDLDLALLEAIAGLDEDVRSCRSSRTPPAAARGARSESPCPRASRARTRRP